MTGNKGTGQQEEWRQVESIGIGSTGDTMQTGKSKTWLANPKVNQRNGPASTDGTGSLVQRKGKQ